MSAGSPEENIITIHVSYQSDPSGERLIFPENHATVTLSAGTSVSWRLPVSELPPGALLYVHFEKPFGPFHGIRSVAPHALLARGNNGEPGPYSYFLYLIVPAASADQSPRVVRSSEPLFIENLSIKRDTSPEGTITYLPNHVHVEPRTLNLFDGDTVLWHIIGLPQDHFLTFQYLGDPEAAGPFPSIFSLRGVWADQETELRRLLGATFSALPLNDQIEYRVQVWDDQGNLVCHDDPSIDSLGKPPGG